MTQYKKKSEHAISEIIANSANYPPVYRDD